MASHTVMYDCVHNADPSIHSWRFMTVAPFVERGKLIQPHRLARDQHTVSRRIQRDVKRHHKLVAAHPDYDLAQIDRAMEKAAAAAANDDEAGREEPAYLYFKHYSCMKEDAQRPGTVEYQVPSYLFSDATGTLEECSAQYDLNAITDRPLYVHPSENPQRLRTRVSIRKQQSCSSSFKQCRRATSSGATLGLAKCAYAVAQRGSAAKLVGNRSNRHGLRTRDSSKEQFAPAKFNSERETYLNAYVRPSMHSYQRGQKFTEPVPEYVHYGRFVEIDLPLSRFDA